MDDDIEGEDLSDVEEDEDMMIQMMIINLMANQDVNKEKAGLNKN